MSAVHFPPNVKFVAYIDFTETTHTVTVRNIVRKKNGKVAVNSMHQFKCGPKKREYRVCLSGPFTKEQARKYAEAYVVTIETAQWDASAKWEPPAGINRGVLLT